MNQEIQKLRAIAFLMVLYTHLGAHVFLEDSRLSKMWWAGQKVIMGWSGVDLFLVISGYVISCVLIERLDCESTWMGKWKVIGAFWIRRYYRLFPTAFLWLLVTLAGSLFFNRSNAFAQPYEIVTDISAYLAQVRNVAYAYAERGQQIGSYWSLSLEDQFYILFPFSLLLFSSTRRRVIFFGLVVLVQFFMIRTLWTLSWHIRTDALSLGVLLYFLTGHPLWRAIEPVFLHSRLKRGVTSAMLLFLAMTLTRALDMVPISVGLLAFTCFIWVWIASYGKNYIVPFGNAFMVWMGNRSYSFYIVHAPSFYISREIWFRILDGGTMPYRSLAISVTGLILMFILSEWNYRCIETPFRKRGYAVASAFEQRVMAVEAAEAERAGAVN